jgi:hypothetical protein
MRHNHTAEVKAKAHFAKDVKQSKSLRHFTAEFAWTRGLPHSYRLKCCTSFVRS